MGGLSDCFFLIVFPGWSYWSACMSSNFEVWVYVDLKLVVLYLYSVSELERLELPCALLIFSV